MNNNRRVFIAAATVAVVLDMVVALAARPAIAQMPDNRACVLNKNEINICSKFAGSECHYSGQCPQPKEDF